MCMYKVPKEVSGLSGQLGYVATCLNQPEPGKVFLLHALQCSRNGGYSHSFESQQELVSFFWFVAD